MGRADDVTTVLFTFELLTRIFEKGYLFFTEEEKNWNFFDSFVVAISLGSMVLSSSSPPPSAAAETHRGHHHGGGGGNGAAADASGGSSMNQIKALRTLRLLRLLRLLRFFKGIEQVNKLVELFLKSLQLAFVGAIVISAL